MGLLADVYSYGDSMKRKVRGLLSDPLGTIEQGIRNFGEDQNQMLQTMQNAYPIPGNKMANFTPAQIDSFRRQLADQATAQGMAGMTVWHGSPHKFDRFDSSKIGTGEGMQAYGHGLYLAESPDVATGYSKMGSGAGGAIPSPLRFINGQEVQAGTGAYKAASLLDSMSVAQAKKTVNGWLQGARPEEQAYFKEVADTLSGINSKAAVKQKAPGGSLYKVDLPDEHIAKMLDYDNVVPESVRQPLSKAALDQFGSGISMGQGSQLLKQVADEFKFQGHPNPNAAASEWLQKQGIPGIRYLDGGSRGTGQGTSNFVIFPGNEGLLQILERNGAPL